MKKAYFLTAAIVLGVAVCGAAPRKGAPRMGAPYVSTPVTLPATDITPTGFTANWKATPGASLYQVTTYEPITVDSDGKYIVLEEGFNYIELGTFLEPYFPDEIYVNLDDYDMVDTPDWQGYLPVFARGMVGGIVYSPYIDLTNDGGKFTVNLSVAGWAGAMVKLTATGSKTETKELYLTENGLNEFAVEFTCGCHDTYLTFVDYGIVNDPTGDYADRWDFIDNIQIIQDLKKGDQVLRLVELYETAEDSGETSHGFYDMKYHNGAKHMAYDVMAISVVYNDPDDDWDYDVYYSDYSPLEHVMMLAGVGNIESENNASEEYFNLQGQRVSGNLAPGIYICRKGTETCKVKK